MNDKEYDKKEVRQQLNEFQAAFHDIKEQVHKVFIGNSELVDDLLGTFFAGGHVLLEGVPGLGKTLLAKSFAQTMNLSFERIQCTPDLMPSDIVGYKTLTESKGHIHEIVFQKGPIIANYVLVDEINRASPKTQSAMLQAMQEGVVTINGKAYDLPQPNIVIATQNPSEHAGTYPLPESEIDRFMVKLNVNYPSTEDYVEIVKLTTANANAEVYTVADVDLLMSMKSLVRNVHIIDEIIAYAVRIVQNTQPNLSLVEGVRKSVLLGAGPRAVQGIIMMAKVKALQDGRMAVSKQDIVKSAPAVLRHRMITHFARKLLAADIENLISEIISKSDKA